MRERQFLAITTRFQLVIQLTQWLLQIKRHSITRTCWMFMVESLFEEQTRQSDDSAFVQIMNPHTSGTSGLFRMPSNDVKTFGRCAVVEYRHERKQMK